MDWNRSISIIIYSLVMIQCTITMVVTYIKVKKTETLYVLLINQILIIMWFVFGIHEIQSANNREVLFAVRLTLFPINMLSGTWLVMAMIYARIITLKNMGIISLIIVPKILLYLPALTNKYFHLILINKNYADPSENIWGVLSTINFDIGYIYIVLGILIILIKAIIDYKILKAKVILLVMGPIITLTTNILLRTRLIPDIGFDITPITFSLFSLFLSLAIFKYDAFGVIQSGAMELFRVNEEAILILDEGNNIIEYNDSVAKEFGQIGDLETIVHISQYFDMLKKVSRNPGRLTKILEDIYKHEEILDCYFVIESTKGKKYYSLVLKAIKDSHNDKIGAIIKIEDHTSHSIGMIKDERSRISGDLHDNLSNMINVVSMNLDYSMKNYDNEENVMKCMGTAYEASSQIRLHLRRILDELTPVNLSKVGVINAVKSLIRRVEGIGVQIEFTHTGINDKINYNKDCGNLMYQTCMEAINNSLFNGHATYIIVNISSDEGMVNIHIKDNGIGCNNILKGRGLTTMEKRYKICDGQVEFESREGKGFIIDAQFPLHYLCDSCGEVETAKLR